MSRFYSRCIIKSRTKVPQNTEDAENFMLARGRIVAVFRPFLNRKENQSHRIGNPEMCERFSLSPLSCPSQLMERGVLENWQRCVLATMTGFLFSKRA